MKRSFLPRIDADDRGLVHEELTEKIIGIFYDVYNELGHGFLESVYEEAMYRAMTSAGLRVRRQAAVPVWFRGDQIGEFFADLVVEEAVIVELKAVHHLDSAHEAQLLHYLRATEMEVGMLFNFGSQPKFQRLAFSNDRKSIRVDRRQSAAGKGEVLG